MTSSIGKINAKVLIQIGDGELIEVGTMDLDLVVKTKPATRGGNISIEVDGPTLSANAGEGIENIGKALRQHATLAAWL